MLGLVLVSLVGVAAAGFLINNVFDDDDDNVPPSDGENPLDLVDNALDLLMSGGDESEDGEGSDEGDQDEDPVTALTRDGDTLFGTEGDDSIGADELSEVDQLDNFGTLDLLDGDDTLTFRGELNFYSTVNGGAGNDSLTAQSDYETVLNGDEGDDTLTAGIGNSAYGGAGDDLINYDHGGGSGDYNVAQLDGGEGDDTILLSEAIGISNLFPDTSSAVVRGGEGADTIVFELIDAVTEATGDIFDVGFEGEDEATIRINDFNPEEDTLVFDISSFAANGNLDYQGAELTEEEAGAYVLRLSFLAEGATEPFTAIVNIRSDEALTLDDIIITSEGASSVG